MYNLPKNINDFSYKNIPDLANKRVIIRSCLNVPLDTDLKITNNTRILEAMPFIDEMVNAAKSVVVVAHLGRPYGELLEEKFSFKNIIEELNSEMIGIPVELYEDVTSIKNLLPQDKKVVYLLENVRGFKGEESSNIEDRKKFAEELATLGDVFINDSFADYRESASTVELSKILPSYLGPVFLSEITALSKLSRPKRRYVAILGGAKLSEKLDLLKSILPITDKILVGGAMAYTFLKAKGIGVGKSLIEEAKIEDAKQLLNKFPNKLVLPVDHLIADNFKADSGTEYTTDQIIPEHKTAIDIGTKTIEVFKHEIAKASTILLNGPMGIFEVEISNVGTKAVMEEVLKNTNAYKVAGGGDTISAINHFNLQGFDHVSTGGGAMLAFISSKNFPTLDAIILKR